MEETDLLVIGGGPGGYTAAIRAGQLGVDVTLVEKQAYGGTCLNYGCIPSKAMLTASKFAHEAENASTMGIYAEPYVDVGEMVEWKDGVVSQLTGGVEQLCRANGVSLVDGMARFSDEHTALVVSRDGTEQSLRFDNCIVATGSRPVEIPGFSFQDAPVLNSRQALALEEVPFRLVIVGAGYIGMELSTVFARLGADVTVIEMLDSVLPTYDDDLTQPVREHAERLGVDFEFGQAATEWSRDGDGIIVVTEDEDGERYKYPAQNVLVAVGREPVTDTLDLHEAGLETNERGFLDIDDRARTSLEHVFAVGDVAGEPMLAHKASYEGTVAAEVTAGEDARLDYSAIPAAVFTDPEIATVGLSEAEAEAANYDTLLGEFPFSASGRALSTGQSDGFVRLVADGDSGRVLGGQIVGAEASELIAEVTLVVRQEITLDELAGTVHTHPTLSEATMEAAENALGKAIHTTNR